MCRVISEHLTPRAGQRDQFIAYTPGLAGANRALCAKRCPLSLKLPLSRLARPERFQKAGKVTPGGDRRDEAIALLLDAGQRPIELLASIVGLVIL